MPDRLPLSEFDVFVQEIEQELSISRGKQLEKEV
jgi:hypothetical protein